MILGKTSRGEFLRYLTNNNNNNKQIYLTSAMPHTELKNKILDGQQITEALGRKSLWGTSVNAIPNSSIFKKDLIE